MKTQLIFIFLFLVSLVSIAQTDILNSIDKKLNECLSDSSGISGQNICLQIATDDWTREMDKQYKLLLDVLPEIEMQNLINAQIKWREYVNAEIILSEKIENDYYKQNPDMLVFPQIAAEREMNIIKTRAIELTNYYNLTQNPH